MGMFDYIECEVTLPRLPEQKEGNKTVVSFPFKDGHQFQTKDLDNALAEYKIGNDRKLYHKKYEYEDRDLTDEEQKDKDSGGFWHPMWGLEVVSKEWVRDHFTGYVSFYDFVTDFDNDNDAWIEFEVHIKNGELQNDVELVTFDLQCNKSRKKSNAEIEARMKARNIYVQKWRYRFFGQYWNKLINRLFRGIRSVGSCLNSSWKLEDKLKF